MLDLKEGPLLSLAEAAKACPGRGPRPVHVATLTRWITRGVGGVRLEAGRLGGRWFTSAAALQRFLEAATAARAGADGRPAAPPSRRRAAEEAERHLDRLGF